MSFTRFAATDFVVSSDSITAPAWSSNQPQLSTFYTASAQACCGGAVGAFYLSVYQSPVVANGSAVQFAIAYGNQEGSGSAWYNPLIPGNSPSKTTYGQYKTLVYGPGITGSTGFNFGGGATNALDIFVINIDRNRYKQSLLPGTFNITLSGSAGQIQLCDNSNDLSTVNYLDCGRVFDLVSGSYGKTASTNSTGQIAPGYTASGSYGFFLPDIGIIVLNASALTLNAAFGGVGMVLDRDNYGATGYTLSPSASYTLANNYVLFNAIQSGANFQLNSQETISSNYVFVRVNNADYNYSTNPSFVDNSGAVLYDTMINSPQTFPTTVGMYNDNNELLAVAKMSKPLTKDFTKEALIRVKLDW